ncbi:hypothetical protein H6503_06135 [Candidatus Woesearchaeota archaeon]|nr:hypothetical protein [Candidatus Woesearchaeota archaeon]
MDEESYRFERLLSFFAIIMIIVIIFTALNFFGIIQPEKWAGEYCISSEKFECQNVVVNFNSIKADIVYMGPGLDFVKFSSDNEGCGIFERTNLKRNQIIKINIECSLTASKGKTYKDELKIIYREIGKLESFEENIDIKSRVQ